jgi:serine/threonine-protein kinase HipA
MSIEVHLDLKGEPRLVGRLYPSDRGSRVSFEYDASWLQNSGFSIDPGSLSLGRGAFHSQTLFGVIADCGPDRWGRVLIDRAVRKSVLGSKPYRDIDYVLALDDASRLGALRFRTDPKGPFLSETTGRVPPLINLSMLLRATEAIHAETETAEDLKFLLGAGSPLGGARPKSAVSLKDGSLALAKFPKPDDVRDIEAGEALCLTLAAQAGINTAEHQLISIKDQNVIVVARFDRAGSQRIPFISAASLLGLAPQESGAYTLMADAIRSQGLNVPADLRELWKRLAFSLLASNYDDHMRNHGFLMHEPGKWSLSPAYDLNPVPIIDRARINKTPISEEGEEPSIEAALRHAPRFDLSPEAAKAILKGVVDTLAGWRKTGQRIGIKAATLDAYNTAFANPLMDEAQALLATKISASKTDLPAKPGLSKLLAEKPPRSSAGAGPSTDTRPKI